MAGLNSVDNAGHLSLKHLVVHSNNYLAFPFVAAKFDMPQDENESLLDYSTSAGQQVCIILKCEISFTPNYPPPPAQLS